MVKIRLARGGAKKRPFYRIVAIDERRSTHGRALEFLGTYDPKPAVEHVHLRTEAIEAWLAKGAQLSPAVKSLMRRANRLAAPPQPKPFVPKPKPVVEEVIAPEATS